MSANLIECDRCGRSYNQDELLPVMVAKQTYSSPAEYSMRCGACVSTFEELEYEDEMRSLQGLTDDERERI